METVRSKQRADARMGGEAEGVDDGEVGGHFLSLYPALAPGR